MFVIKPSTKRYIRTVEIFLRDNMRNVYVCNKSSVAS